MKFTTKNLKYSILAGLAAYGTYSLVFDIIGIGHMLNNCHLSSEGTINVVCYVFGLS